MPRTTGQLAGHALAALAVTAGLLLTVFSEAAMARSPVGTGSSPGAPAFLPSCRPAQVEQAVRLNHRRYQRGQAVVIKVVARNTSAHDCVPPATVRVSVRHPSGTTVWGSGVGIFWAAGSRWHPGQELSWSFVWHPGTASPGSYLAVGGWAAYPPASVGFTIGT